MPPLPPHIIEEIRKREREKEERRRQPLPLQLPVPDPLPPLPKEPKERNPDDGDNGVVIIDPSRDESSDTGEGERGICEISFF